MHNEAYSDPYPLCDLLLTTQSSLGGWLIIGNPKIVGQY